MQFSYLEFQISENEKSALPIASFDFGGLYPKSDLHLNHGKRFRNNDDGGTSESFSAKARPESQFRVSGTVTYTANYCGGAAPSEEMLAEMRQPKPRFGQELLVRSGDFNSFGRLLARATTKGDGSFEFFLAPGDYCIVIAQKESADMVPKSSEYIHVDTECYNKWMATCDLSFRLADREISGLSLNLHQACFTNSYSTCVQWDGPMPPSAPRRDHE